MILLVSAALAADGVVVCQGTLHTPSGTVGVQAFGADFDHAKARTVEHAWTVAEFHQHRELWAVLDGDAQARSDLTARYAGLDASDPSRVPGYRVTSGACEALPVARSDGDWEARWAGTSASADSPWVALELARRRACFGDYTPGDIDALAGCLAADPTAPTARRDPLPGPSTPQPYYICQAEGWDGGGATFDAARLDALDAHTLGAARAGIGLALSDLEAMGAVGAPDALPVVSGASLADELSAVRCAPPGRPLTTESGAQCSGASSDVRLSPQGDLAEVTQACHAAAVAPTFALLPGSDPSIVVGAIGLAARCDAVCRKGFDVGSYPIE